MKFFVTGGTGFIGSHVVENLVNRGLEVVALRRPGSQPRIKLPKDPKWLEGGLESDVSEALNGTTVFLHLAAHGVNPKQDCFSECMRWNLMASLNLWQRAAGLGVRRFVIAGSCFEYGLSGEEFERLPVDAPLTPVSGYGASKAAASIAACAMARNQKLELAILRPFHVFGEGEAPDRFFPMLKAAALAGADFPMSPGEQVRDFVPVQDAAAAFVDFVSRPLEPGLPEIHNLGSGKAQSLLEFARTWWATWNARGRLLPGALPYRPGEIMRYVPALTAVHDCAVV
jgi:UDP-glucose 4-epimerase